LQELAHRQPMLPGNGEVHAAQPAAVPDVQGRLHEVLLQGRPGRIAVPVEFQQRLGFAGVVEPSLVQDEVENLALPARGPGLRRAAAGFRQGLAQVPVKGMARQVLREGVGFLPAREPASVEGGMPVSEHARGGARGGNERQAATGLRRPVEKGCQAGLLVPGEPDDPVTDRGRPVEGHVRRAQQEPVDLSRHALFRRTPGADEFDVRWAEHDAVTSVSADPVFV